MPSAPWARRWCVHTAVELAVAALASSACADGENRADALGADPQRPEVPEGSCAVPDAGCPCDEDGQEVECGTTQETFGDYVTCSKGTRTCEGDSWGVCVGERTTLLSTFRGGLPASGARLLALGVEATACPADFDPCDPYCKLIEDEPDEELELPDGFTIDDGLTLTGTGSASCTTLTLTPSSSSVTVTDFSPLTVVKTSNVAQTSNPITFTLVAGPPGCTTTPFTTTWTIDRVDRAAISGSSSADGSLTLAVPLAGSIHVTAYALGLSATTDITVKVNVLETTSISPNGAPTSSHGHVAAFGAWNSPAAGSVASSTTWLYPYASAYFPLGLPAPVVQYWCSPAVSGTTNTTTACRTSTSTGVTRATKVSLRYPVDTSSNPASTSYSDFNYSIIVAEANVVSRNAEDPVDVASNVWDPQVVIPQDAWEYFEQTARGADADLVVQRRARLSSTVSVLENESRRRIHFVDGQLKGTVYYNTYNSPQASNTGAVLAITPGATSPTVAVQPSGRCITCHTVNLDGTRLIANGSSNATFNSSRRYNLNSTFPSPTVLNSYNKSTSSDSANVPGDRFTFGAPWLDGTLYMTHGGDSSGDPNWRAPPATSRLYSINDANTAISVTNWPTNVEAVTPRFSPTGTKLAFGFWGGSTLPRSPSGTLSSASAGTRLAVVDFSCSSPPCSSSSTGWVVSNARDVTPSVSSGTNSTSGTLKVARPSFTPDGNAVLYQRQYRTSRSLANGGVLTSGWSPSDINTVAGALAEVWMSDVPTNGSTAASPTRLLALNGLNSDGSAYLPQDDQRAASSTGTQYHRNAATSFGITQADWCSNIGTATNVVDNRLNYLPAVAPTEAGGYHWVIFTSRRMYGNIAYDDPWDAEPCNPNGSPPTSCSSNSCYSGMPPAKKLWVAAIDKNWTPGTDPSHPAFYLPGQELEAGNSDGYWVSSACAELGEACETNDDCCDGTGDSATTECKVVSAATVPPDSECQNKSSCSEAGEACTTTADCCSGLTCPDGGGLCLTVPSTIFEENEFVRTYDAECPEGLHREWRFFEWQATIPAGTSIDFEVQASSLEDDDYEPTPPVWIGSATSTTPVNTWHRGPSPVDDVLAAAALPSLRYLRVIMTFHPDSEGSVAPTLHNWRQIVDCVPEE